MSNNFLGVPNFLKPLDTHVEHVYNPKPLNTKRCRHKKVEHQKKKQISTNCFKIMQTAPQKGRFFVAQKAFDKKKSFDKIKIPAKTLTIE